MPVVADALDVDVVDPVSVHVRSARTFGIPPQREPGQDGREDAGHQDRELGDRFVGAAFERQFAISSDTVNPMPVRSPTGRRSRTPMPAAAAGE